MARSSLLFGCCIVFLFLLLLCGESPVAAADAAFRPRKYGPATLGELGYMQVAAADDVFGSMVRQQGRFLLEAMNEINVQREADLLKDPHEKNVDQEPKLLQQLDHHVTVTSNPTDQHLEEIEGAQEVQKEEAILEGVKPEVKAGIGLKPNLAGMHLKTEGPELKTEEKELSKSELGEDMLKIEDKESADPVKKKVGSETELKAAEEKELKLEDAEERSEKSKEEVSKSVKKKVGRKNKVKSKEEEKELSTPDDDAQQQAGEEVDEEKASVGKKDAGSQAEMAEAAEEKTFSKSEARQVVEEEQQQQQQEKESIPVKKKVGNENIEQQVATAAAEEKELSQVPGSQEVAQEKEIVAVENNKMVSISAENENTMPQEKEGMKQTNKHTTTSPELKPENQELVKLGEGVKEQKQQEGRVTAVEKLPKELMKIKGAASNSGEGSQEELSKDLVATDSKVQQEGGGQLPDKEKSAAGELTSVEQEAVGIEQKGDVKVNGQNEATKSDNVEEKKEGSDDSEAKSEENLMSKAAAKLQQDRGQLPDEEKSAGELRSVEQEAGSGQNDNVNVNGQNKAIKLDNVEKKEEGTNESEAKSQSEKMSKTASTVAAEEEADPATDVDSSGVTLLPDLPTNFQQTVGAVASHVIPQLQQISDQSMNSFDKINRNLASSFLPWIGEKYAPIIATLISYCLLLPPLALVLFLCERIRAILTLQKVLLFINIYLVTYFAILLIVALGLGSEPTAFLDQYSPFGYMILQLLQAFGYMIYMLLQTADVIITCATGSPIGKTSAVIQWLLALMVGLHYYVTVFHRAMAKQHPHISWKFYGFYSLSFLVCCLLARTQQSKKEYIPLGDETTDKKN